MDAAFALSLIAAVFSTIGLALIIYMFIWMRQPPIDDQGE